jgi:ubiquinone/menaquinone biosynthesis C-methylase UbiE
MNRREYFDDLADRWDHCYEIDRVLPLLKERLLAFKIHPAEQVIDLGCGTGVLLGCLLDHLDENGAVTAVDISERMIEKARAKHKDDRVRFLVADAARIPVPDSGADRVLCFSAWPHFPDPDAVIGELLRVLKPGGRLHVWHADSRDKINDIHKHAHHSVSGDMLEPADRLAERMRSAGMQIEERRDDQEAYLVSARKEPGR